MKKERKKKKDKDGQSGVYESIKRLDAHDKYEREFDDLLERVGDLDQIQIETTRMRKEK